MEQLTTSRIIEPKNEFEVISWDADKNDYCRPHRIKRVHDGAFFQVGDRVTNGRTYCGVRCEGKILYFEINKNGEFFFETTWAGTSWELRDIHLVEVLPSLWQIADRVQVQFPGNGNIGYALVSKVSFVENRCLYDVSVPFFEVGDANPERKVVKHERLHGLDERRLSAPGVLPEVCL